MVLVYALFALTVSAILTAVFSRTASRHRQGHAFLDFFALLLLLAGTADGWLAPAVSSGPRSGVYPIVFLAVFAAILTVSLILSIRSGNTLKLAEGDRSTRLETEAAVFDSLVWLAMTLSGIAILKAFVI